MLRLNFSKLPVLTLVAAPLLCSLFWSLPALSSVQSEKELESLQGRIHRTVAQLKHTASLQERVAIVKNFRVYVARELQKQQDVTDPDATDDRLALTLIGFDDDLGSFIDEPTPDFSQAKCAGDRIALIHSYTPAGEDREPANLPLHAQQSLRMLDLLCGNG